MTAAFRYALPLDSTTHACQLVGNRESHEGVIHTSFLYKISMEPRSVIDGEVRNSAFRSNRRQFPTRDGKDTWHRWDALLFVHMQIDYASIPVVRVRPDLFVIAAPLGDVAAIQHSSCFPPNSPVIESSALAGSVLNPAWPYEEFFATVTLTCTRYPSQARKSTIACMTLSTDWAYLSMLAMD